MAASSSSIDLSAALVLEPVAALDWLVVLPVAWCIGIGAILMMVRHRGSVQPVIAIAALAVLVGLDWALLRHVAGQGPVTMVMGRWLPPFGIAFTVDLTGALFALFAAIVALAGAVAAITDINASGRRYGFYPCVMLLMAGVSGAFLTGDIFNLYVWFEVLLISSFGLLVLGGEREQIDGAVKYGFLNLVATTLFLIATGYLYGIFGTLNMADIARKAPELKETAPLVTLTALWGDGWQLAGAIVFAVALLLLYVASTLYHAITHAGAKARLKVFDHCAIFLLIAGTYTPFTLISLRGAMGWALFATIWALAFAGIVFKLFFTGRFKLMSTLMYVAMGWLSDPSVPPSFVWTLRGLAVAGIVARLIRQRKPEPPSA